MEAREGFEWIDFHDSAQSVVSYLRKADDETMLVVLNHTPVLREGYRVGVPEPGIYDVVLNSDDGEFGGEWRGYRRRSCSRGCCTTWTGVVCAACVAAVGCSLSEIAKESGARFMKKLCVHAHFYQPTREDLLRGGWRKEESAAPYVNWNARITAECYGPNIAARLLDNEGNYRDERNNYAYVSFDCGPTF